MKLLYAEDEPGLSEAVVDILTYYKYQVDAVDNGTDALAYAEAEHYDGIILDVMIYQSMSGDAEVGTFSFSMIGGTLTSKNGDMFYVTNTHCTLTLSGVKIVNQDSDGVLMRVVGNCTISSLDNQGTINYNGYTITLADGTILK